MAISWAMTLITSTMTNRTRPKTAAKREQNPTAPVEDDQDKRREARPSSPKNEQQDASQAQVSMDEMADQELGEEAEMPDGEAPLEPPAPQPISDADPTIMVYQTAIRRRNSRRRSWPSRSNSSACVPIWTNSLNRSKARCPPGQQIATPSAGATKPLLGI